MQLKSSTWLSWLVLSATIGCQSSADHDDPSGEAPREDSTATGGSETGSDTADNGTADNGTADNGTADSDSVSSTSASDSTSATGSGGSISTGGSDSADTATAGGTGGASASASTTDADADASTTSMSAALYANVVAVAASGDPGSFTFDVSIESADIDCSQYADWWEVLSEDGVLIYRRILTHSHTDENGTSDPDAPGNTFTRDGGPIDIAADEVVIVRAHMSNSDIYNGMVMRGSVTSGFSEAPEVGADFAADIEDDPPQPESCLF